MAEITHQTEWKDLPNWHKASKDGFPLYRATNDTFMDLVRKGGNTIHIIFIVLML